MSERKTFQPFVPDTFDRWHEERQDLAPYLRAMYPQIEPLLEGAETIVDLAGGEGYTHDVLSERFSPRLTTVDLDEGALQRLKARYPEAATVKGDTNRLPFEDESFDAAIAINGIGGSQATATRKIREARRVLKPGGTLVFLHDLPNDTLYHRAVNWLEMLPAGQRDDFYALPILDRVSGNVDVVAHLWKEHVENLRYSEGISGAAAAQSTEHLLGGDWMHKVYSDKLMLATHAKLFTRLAAEVQAAYSGPPTHLGFSAVFLEEPIVQETKKNILEWMNGVDGIEGEIRTLEVDYRTDEVHRIEGREVASLYVDELVLPRIVYKTAASQKPGTRIRGKTPVSIARKLQTA